MKRTFIILCFLFTSVVLFSQLAKTPEVISVSVRPLTDSVTIKWKPSPSINVDGYLVFDYYFHGVYTGLASDTVLIVGPSINSVTFKYPKVLTQPVKFYISAFNSTGRSSMVQYHQTIFTQLQYDTCNSSVTIKWTKYIGWGNDFNKYTVYQIDASGKQDIVKDNISFSDTILTIPVGSNKNYCFTVCALNKDVTIASYSNGACCFTKSDISPNYIIANYASFNPNSNNPVNLKFKVDTAAQIKKYQLYTSDNSESGFSPLKDPIIATKDSVVFQDNTISSTPRYYRLEALNFCGHVVAQSNIATAMIIPKLIAQSNEISFVWNEYKGWYQGVAQYKIYRKIGNDVAQVIGNTGVNGFTDNVSSLVGQQFSGNICYYVEAVSKSDSSGNVYHNFSSNNCIDLSEAVFVPEGFTPNGDGLNDEFKPSFAFLPNEFVMVVYNRYGFKIFETKDALKGWDGTIGSGQKAPEGTYVYFIKFSSQTGKTVEKKGNFSLIYP